MYNTQIFSNKMGIGKMTRDDVPDGVGKMQHDKHGIGKMQGHDNFKKSKKGAAVAAAEAEDDK